MSGWKNSTAGAGVASCYAAGGRGLNGRSMQVSLLVDFVLCLAISLITTLNFTPAVPLIELVFLRNAGVSETSLSGVHTPG